MTAARSTSRCRRVAIEDSNQGSDQSRLDFEAVPGFDSLSGTWTITIDKFYRSIPDPGSDVSTEQESIVGPWVLTIERPAAQAP